MKSLSIGPGDPRYDALDAYHLTAAEQAQMAGLYGLPDGLTLLDRVVGVFASNPLALEAEQFGEVQEILVKRCNAPALAARLVAEAGRRGGLLPRAEALRRYQRFGGTSVV